MTCDLLSHCSLWSLLSLWSIQSYKIKKVTAGITVCLRRWQMSMGNFSYKLSKIFSWISLYSFVKTELVKISYKTMRGCWQLSPVITCQWWFHKATLECGSNQISKSWDTQYIWRDYKCHQDRCWFVEKCLHDIWNL